MQNKSKNIKLWFGNDAYGISETLSEEKKCVIKNDRNAEIGVFDFGSGEKRTEIEKKLQNVLRGNSLFSSEKLIVVKDFFSSKKNKTVDLEQEIDESNPGSKNNFEENLFEIVLKNTTDGIIFIEERSLDKRGKAYKFFEKLSNEGRAEQKEFLIPLQFEFNTWLEKTLRERGGKISKENINILAIILGKGMEQREHGSVIAAYDLFQSSMEIDKLVAYCDGREIMGEDIELLVSASSDMNIFNLIESIGSRNKKKSLEILSEQIEKGFNENYILTMLVYHFRNLITVKNLVEQGCGVDEIVKAAKMHPFVAQKNIQYCRNLSKTYLATVYGKLYNADINIKNGLMEPELALDLLLVAI